MLFCPPENIIAIRSPPPELDRPAQQPRAAETERQQHDHEAEQAQPTPRTSSLPQIPCSTAPEKAT